MTAINPAKLKMQVAALGELISQPERFTARLHELLSFYSARIRQTRLANTSQILKTYQAAKPVILALENEIAEKLKDEPEAGFTLLDRLWEEYWVEFRQLAIHVLGLLPSDQPDRIIHRAQAWLEDCSSEDIRRLIMTRGMSRLANARPQESLQFIDELISSGSNENLQAALFGLEFYAKNPSYLNLPLLFNYLSKILLAETSGLSKEISALLRILASRSEQETTYFLLNQLSPDHNPRILRVIRQVMDNLSPDNQDLLREKIETYRN